MHIYSVWEECVCGVCVSECDTWVSLRRSPVAPDLSSRSLPNKCLVYLA
jgi:hypothetical protein